MRHVTGGVILAAMLAGLAGGCTVYDGPAYHRTYAYTTDDYYYARPVRYQAVRVYYPNADSYYGEYDRYTP